MIATGNVTIDPARIPKVEIDRLYRKLIPMIEKYLSDPQHRAECDEWVAEYRRRKELPALCQQETG